MFPLHRGASSPRVAWEWRGDSLQAIAPTGNIGTAIRDNLSRIAEFYLLDSIPGVAADLNRDGVDDYIIELRGPMCGTGECPYMIFDGASAKAIGDVWGGPLLVRTERRKGYPTIDAFSWGGASSGTLSSFEFDGTRYVERTRRLLQGSDAIAGALGPYQLLPTRPKMRSIEDIVRDAGARFHRHPRAMARRRV